MIWKPIETAPQDGTEFLMYITGFSYRRYNANDKYKVKEIKEICIAEYVSRCNNFFAIARDNVRTVDSLHFKGKDRWDFIDVIEEYQATHWMPLPELPKEE